MNLIQEKELALLSWAYDLQCRRLQGQHDLVDPEDHTEQIEVANGEDHR